MHSIRLGIPETETLWSELKAKAESDTLSKDAALLYKKWGKALNEVYRSLCRLMNHFFLVCA
jgi:hypothetical protein